ncbi:MAG: DUF4249 domain-containing protein [Flavobacteriales bacterium]|jgi:hypothetical protein|nr:DUF4249 domain-containing protein [Flavobacteriales bacterium]|tara:strand:- start:7799 stop:8776 length:978 start_codon:yes stop_codon:yes gene_type:complete
MKNLKNIISLISIVTLSCGEMETVIDLEIPVHDPVLVLNGRLDTDTNIQVLISSSVGAFDNTTPSMVNDANVILFENNIEIETLTLDTENTYEMYVNNGNWNNVTYIDMNYYVSNYIPKQDMTYKIEVKHPSFNDIDASTYIPDNILIYNFVIDSTSNDDKLNFEFSFDDDANIENYYSLSLKVSCSKVFEDEYGYIDEWYWDGRVEMNSNDPSFPSNNFDVLDGGYRFQGERAVFNDALFNGQEKRISVDVFTDEYQYAQCDTIKFIFSTFSDDSYKYYNSLSEQREKGGLDIFGGEVVPVFTNVNNGLGVFLSKNAQEVYIKP